MSDVNYPVVVTSIVVVVLMLAFLSRLLSKKKVALKDPREKITVKLIEKEEISHDVRRFRFALPEPDMVLGLPVGKCVFVSYTEPGQPPVSRAYTPVSSDDDVGYMDLVVKVYFKNVHPRFPDGGKMSQHLNDMKIGDTIQMKGPIGHLEYKGKGELTQTKSGKVDNYSVKHIGMIAGGSGITPMLQVIRQVMKTADDSTQISLLYANQTEEDILLRAELEAEAAKHPNLKVWYTVDRPPTDGSWKYSSGFINEEMIRDHLPVNEKDALILMCGPPPMIKFACLPNIEKNGFNMKNVLSF